VLGDDHSQAAQLTLTPGEAESGSVNRHRGADQWLFVVAGTGKAVVNGETVPL
jgi:mannose-6-phosphate isomerase-like protein (cupin superfamily)